MTTLGAPEVGAQPATRHLRGGVSRTFPAGPPALLRRRFPDSGIVRDEAGQAAELGAVLDLVEYSGIDGAFVYTYVAPSYPSSREAALDLDAASYALVGSWPDGSTERRAESGVVADRFASSTG